MSCGCTQEVNPLSLEECLQKKKVVAWKMWFVSADGGNLERYCSEGTDNIRLLPRDGFLCAKTRLADGTYENIGGNGWVVVKETPIGLLLQATGENTKPSVERYPGAVFIKDMLAPSALMHAAHEEQQAWR